jgi:translation initiation factor IF-1
VKSRSFLAALCLAIVFLGASPPAWVHHSGAMFDKTRTIQITGVVKEFLWTNPHSSFKVEVPEAGGGDAQLWSIEMNATSNLVHEGWKKTTIKPGDKVTVTINPLRDGRPGGWFIGITLPNGSTLGTPTAASAEGAAP